MIFLIQIFGGLTDVPIDMTMGTTLVIFVTAVLASIGAAAVPEPATLGMLLTAGGLGLLARPRRVPH